jgi:hypothetical protein
MQTKLQSISQTNQLSIERLFRATETPDIILVGSSLAEQLDFKDIHFCIYNMALGGDSALTGLSALARSGLIPKKVYIEINVPERGINKDLIDKASGMLPKLSSVFYVENKPINLVYSWLLQITKHNGSGSEVNEVVRQNFIDLHRQNTSQALTFEVLTKSTAEYIALVNDLESKGTKIIFFEMPIYPDLEKLPHMIQVRSAFKEAFPNNQFIDYDDLSNGLIIKTRDGIHLTQDEAKNVVYVFKDYFKGLCNN